MNFITIIILINIFPNTATTQIRYETFMTKLNDQDPANPAIRHVCNDCTQEFDSKNALYYHRRDHQKTVNLKSDDGTCTFLH